MISRNIFSSQRSTAFAVICEFPNRKIQCFSSSVFCFCVPLNAIQIREKIVIFFARNSIKWKQSWSIWFKIRTNILENNCGKFPEIMMFDEKLFSVGIFKTAHFRTNQHEREHKIRLKFMFENNWGKYTRISTCFYQNFHF